ncbi:MAG: tetratricopeptide repeat protein, partial [Deltaproteobacteria bacterium]|nr:tetratricopeptide repeat protein [Deltaproteobacteria bacterium]
MIKIYSIVVTLLLGMASAATAERLTLNPEAKVLFEQGMRDYQAGRYDAALRSFEQAHQLAPRPELLFAMAQAARLGHRCEQASRYYDQFLATKPSERQVDAARQLRGQCKPGPAKVVAEEPARSSKVFTPDFDSSAQVSAPEAAPSQPSPAPIVAAKSSQRDDSSAWY